MLVPLEIGTEASQALPSRSVSWFPSGLGLGMVECLSASHTEHKIQEYYNQKEWENVQLMLLLHYTRFLNENIETVATNINAEKEREREQGGRERMKKKINVQTSSDAHPA